MQDLLTQAEISRRNREFYESLRNRRPPRPGPDQDAQLVGFWNREDQLRNFGLSTSHVSDLASLQRVLDVGCGLGELYFFLHERGFRGHYTGVELQADLADLARQRLSGYAPHAGKSATRCGSTASTWHASSPLVACSASWDSTLATTRCPSTYAETPL